MHSKRLGLITLLVATTSSNAGAQAIERLPADSAVVRGVVLDGQARFPIPDALLHVLGNASTHVVQSDEQGRFTLAVSAPGTYRISAMRLGYEISQSQPLAVAPGDTIDLDFSLTSAPALLDSILVSVEQSRRPLRTGEQFIEGVVIDDATGAPIGAGTIRLENVAGSTVAVVQSNDQGYFRLVSPRPGMYRVSGERIGYRPAESSDLYLMPGDSIALELRLSTQAVLLAPITVLASARPWSNRANLGRLREFFERQARFARSGFGDFLTRDSIAAYEGRVTTAGHMLMLSTLSVRGVTQDGAVVLRDGCHPVYAVNGIRAPFMPIVFPEDLEAVEIYNGPNIPAELAQGGFPCGIIVYWTGVSPDRKQP